MTIANLIRGESETDEIRRRLLDHVSDRSSSSLCTPGCGPVRFGAPTTERSPANPLSCPKGNTHTIALDRSGLERGTETASYYARA